MMHNITKWRCIVWRLKALLLYDVGLAWARDIEEAYATKCSRTTKWSNQSTRNYHMPTTGVKILADRHLLDMLLQPMRGEAEMMGMAAFIIIRDLDCAGEGVFKPLYAHGIDRQADDDFGDDIVKSWQARCSRHFAISNTIAVRWHFNMINSKISLANNDKRQIFIYFTIGY